MRLGSGPLGSPTVTVVENSAPPRIQLGLGGALRVLLSEDEAVDLAEQLIESIAELRAHHTKGNHD